MTKKKVKHKAPDPNLPVLKPPNTPVPLGYLIELRNKGLKLKEIAKIVGVTDATICERLQRHKHAIDNLQAVKDNRADVFTLMGDDMLTSLSETDKNKMSGLQKVTAMGILYDKERLERDKSTKILAFKDLQSDHDSIVKERKALALELGYDSPDGPGDIDDTGPIMAEPEDD